MEIKQNALFLTSYLKSSSFAPWYCSSFFFCPFRDPSAQGWGQPESFKSPVRPRKKPVSQQYTFQPSLNEVYLGEKVVFGSFLWFFLASRCPPANPPQATCRGSSHCSRCKENVEPLVLCLGLSCHHAACPGSQGTQHLCKHSIFMPQSRVNLSK